MKKLFLSLLISTFTFSCVDLYNPDIKTGNQRLVVESHLTTQLETQYVLLSYDAGYNSDESTFKFLVKRAKVSIIDDKGTVYDFTDDPAQNNQIKSLEGYNYKSITKFKAEVGRSYQLLVSTLNGEKYQSIFEKVLPAPSISKIYSEFKETIPPAKVAGNFNVYVDIRDPAEQKNFYMWRSYHVRQLNFCREWYIFGSGGSVTSPNIDKCCDPCYEKTICEDCFELANDKLVNGNSLIKQFVTTVPYLETKPYYLVINQYSLNEAAYKYWFALKQQSKNSGGLFDATPQSLQGNIRNINNEKEEVLGYFTVSDVSKQITHIERNIGSPRPFPYVEYSDFYRRTDTCWPCEETYKRTKTAPPGWRF